MSDVEETVLKISNSKGLHARASAKFVRCVEAFDASVQVSKDGYDVGGTSIMGLMMLGASKGSEIKVQANGTDAKAVIDALSELVSNKFGESD